MCSEAKITRGGLRREFRVFQAVFIWSSCILSGRKHLREWPYIPVIKRSFDCNLKGNMILFNSVRCRKKKWFTTVSSRAIWKYVNFINMFDKYRLLRRLNKCLVYASQRKWSPVWRTFFDIPVNMNEGKLNLSSWHDLNSVLQPLRDHKICQQRFTFKLDCKSCLIWRLQKVAIELS